MNRRRRLRTLPTIADMAKAFGCVDAMLDKLSQGWIHEIQGQPVFKFQSTRPCGARPTPVPV